MTGSEQGLERLIRDVFAAIEAKDLAGVMNRFATDAVLFDPHFPEPRMVGHAAIAPALQQAFKGMTAFGYTIERYFETRDGTTAAVEVATHHVVRKGLRLDFPQVFVFEVADGLVRRMQAYEPYGPHGVFGMVLGIERITRSLLRSMARRRRHHNHLERGGMMA